MFNYEWLAQMVMKIYLHFTISPYLLPLNIPLKELFHSIFTLAPNSSLCIVV